MELGWIDFSKDDKEKVLDVLNLLSEPGVLDELGIAPIRDKFSDLFFPGTSTIQTRAKYFLIVPYALRDLQLKYDLNQISLATLDDIERESAYYLYKNNPENGIIGSDSIPHGWVQRPPSSVYLSGLRKYKIFNYEKSLDSYIKKVIIRNKINYENHAKSVNKNDDGELIDDKDAGKSQLKHYLNIPIPEEDWMENLNIKLTSSEAKFLKGQIISSCKDSMMAHILRNREDFECIVHYSSFYDLKNVIDKFPDKIQKDYSDAILFSDFNYALRIIYNCIVSDNENKEAVEEFNKIESDKLSNIDINRIMYERDVRNKELKDFLNNAKRCIANENMGELKEIIKNREVYLKGINRSRTLKIGKYDINEWFVGKHLDYRFQTAKVIINDIFKGEDSDEGDA